MALFQPIGRFHRITDIPAEYFMSLGVKGIAVDADNTLSEHHSQQPLDGVEAWLRSMQQQGLQVFMVSNAKHRRVHPFAQKLGLSYVSLALKPLPVGLLRAKRQMGLRAGEMAVIGDQLFTDMLAAHLCGAKAILVEPIHEESGASFRVRRRMEQKLLRRYEEKSV